MGQGFSVEFEDTTRQAFGSIPKGPSFGGGAWGDFNQDGYPDLWLGNHAGVPHLWQNQGDGSFVDVASQMLPALQASDAHGSAWADFDRDGDLDLIECAGAELGLGIGPNTLWENRYPLPFREIARYVGRARSPLWLDWNEDGLLDLVIAAFEGKNSGDVVFTQLPNGSFAPELGTIGFSPTRENTRLAQLADYNSDGRLDLLLQARIFPDSLMSFGPSGFVPYQLPPSVGTLSNVQDLAVGDFDGDQDMDFYLTRDPFWAKGQVAVDANGALRAAVRISQGLTEFSFRCAGEMVAELPVGMDPAQVFLGANRVPAKQLPLTMRLTDKRMIGINPGAAGSPFAIYIGREDDSDTWRLTVTTDMEINGSIVIRSRSPIELLDGDVDRQRDSPDGVIWSDGANSSVTRPDAEFSGRSVISADFDNDGDLDLYVMRTGAAVNRLNRLYENLGQGEFRIVPFAAGASGPRLGVADSVSVVDYDLDGFLDLFLTNGWGTRPLVADAPVCLLRNRGGNGNHWLQIELQGTRSNPHGIGAVVRVETAQGTQRRDQDGGIHRSTQNHSRLHFGLGSELRVQRIEVTWPDGSVQELLDLPVDQVLTIVQA